jgi:hypothetical protein
MSNLFLFAHTHTNDLIRNFVFWTLLCVFLVRDCPFITLFPRSSLPVVLMGNKSDYYC